MKKTHYTLFFPMPEHANGFIRISAYVDEIPHLLKMGYFLSPEEFPKNARPSSQEQQTEAPPSASIEEQQQEQVAPSAEYLVADGDKGENCRPGSPRWHELAINQMTSKKEVGAYAQELYGFEFRPRTHLQTMKKILINKIYTEASNGRESRHTD